MTYFILSDDLTGASGVASMVGKGTAITVNLDRLQSVLGNGFSCVAVNLNVRDRPDSARNAIARALEFIDESPSLLRIDSALRGPTKTLVTAMLERNDLLLTDTIPEYGRITVQGKTIVRGGRSVDLRSAVGVDSQRSKHHIADSATWEDLDRLATGVSRGGHLAGGSGAASLAVPEAREPCPGNGA